MRRQMSAVVGTWHASGAGFADCDASAARAVELGATQHVAPTDIPPGRFAVLQDPTGPVFSIITFAQDEPD